MSLTPWVTRLIVANVVVYFASMAFPQLASLLVLVPAFVWVRPWTLVTYMFLHAGLSHIFFNMLGLFFFGPRLEAKLAGNQFLWLYLISGISGGLLSLPFTPYAQIVGASGAVFGVLLGFARYWPRERIYIWGVLPVEARILVLVTTLMALFGGFTGGGGGVAHFAHLGGFVGGYAYLKYVDWTSPGHKLAARQRPPPRARVDASSWSRIRRDKLHEVNRAELDRILEKIQERGAASLSDNERIFLDNMRDMSDRLAQN